MIKMLTLILIGIIIGWYLPKPGFVDTTKDKVVGIIIKLKDKIKGIFVK